MLYFSAPFSDNLSFSSDRVTYLSAAEASWAVQKTEAMIRKLRLIVEMICLEGLGRTVLDRGMLKLR